MSHQALDCQGMMRRFGRRTILRDVDLQVAPGERVALLGDNGAGKTTFLRVAATLLRPSEGKMLVVGHDTLQDPVAARGGLGFLDQDAAAYPELTAHETLAWLQRMHGHPRDRAWVRAALEDAGIAAMADRSVADLSRGQRQRLRLAHVLALPVPLLLLDEPFSGLDASGRTWLEARLQAHDAAMVIALHDDAQARRLCHRQVRIEAGRLHEGPAHDTPAAPRAVTPAEGP